MNAQMRAALESRRLQTTRREDCHPRGLCAASVFLAGCASTLLLSMPALADEPPATSSPPVHDHAQMNSTEAPGADTEPQHPMPMEKQAPHSMSMDMGAMQGGVAPPDARDPNAYAEGYEYTGMPGMEQSDRITVRKVFPEQFELVRGDDADGFAWDMQISYGGDERKLWFRTEGSAANGSVGPTTSAEGLWWRAFSPFWASQLGVRQDFGAGAHTYLAFGVQGLAPYWFTLEATGYVAEDGRVGARLKGSYDVLFTNRLILTPSVESNLYGRAEPERDLGSGVGNLELGVRLRYEFSRKFAPYAGYVWDRAYGGTADRFRSAGKEVTDRQIVAGVRIWW